MGGSKILRIFGLIFTLIGAFLIVWQYMTGRAPGLRIFFVVLTIAGLVAIVYEFGREIRARVVTVERLEDAESIRRSFTKMLQDAKRVLFVGALDDALAEAILQRWNSRVDGEHLRVGVYNTDPDFHGTEGPAAELAKHCADHESFDFRFIFYRQTVDSLAVVRQKDRSDVLFRWRDGAGQPKGLRVKDTVWPFGEFLREVPVATIDDVCGNQGPELKSVRDLFEEYCQPLKSGWSYPVLPLREWEAVQAEITAHNLKWFNDAATRLIEYGSPALNTVCVTWCLHDGSAQDGKVFAQWLDRLRTSSVAVNRYVFIDTDRYATNEPYKTVVKEIDGTYFQGLRTDYKMHYVPLRELTQKGIPHTDFALFNLQTGTWAQSSVLNPSKSGRQFVRVWFCRTAGVRNVYTSLFEILGDRGTMKYAALAELDAAIAKEKGQTV